MARIMIENLYKRTIVASDHSKSLLKHFQANQIDWMHACGGKGRCTTCKVMILEGADHFDALTKAEEKYFQQGALKIGERLSCQAKVRGNVRLKVPKEYQLPHLSYSDDV